MSDNSAPQPDEIWRNLPDYIGIYQVSDQGRVRSLTRTVTDKNGRSSTLAGRIITPALVGKGVLQFVASESGVQKKMTVHAAVLAAHHGPRPEGSIILHLNGDPTDNRLVNLRYGTREEASQAARLRGTLKGMKQTTCPQGHALLEPNLVASQLKRGARLCKACHRAHATIASRGLDRGRLQEISDEHYARIIAGDPPRQLATHCMRGHRLIAPNLVRGRHSCLACNRAHGYAARHPHLKNPEDLQRLADRYHADLGKHNNRRRYP